MKFMSKILNLNEKHLYILICLIFSIISFYHLSSGFHTASDTVRFSRWADYLIKLNFNFYDLYFSDIVNSERIAPFFFTIPVFLISLCKLFFGNDWQTGFLLLNLIFLFLSLVIFIKTLLLLRIRPFIILLSFPLILISVDILTWPRYMLSDMNFAFLVMFSVYFITKGIIENKFDHLIIYLILFLMLITRPSSISVISAIILFIIVSKYEIFGNPRTVIIFLIALLISTPLLFALLYYLIELKFNQISQLQWLSSMVKVGMIIHDRPETWVKIPNNFIDVMNIYFLRLINFFNPYAETFSTIHIFFNIIQTFFISLSISIWLIFEKNKILGHKIFMFIIILSFFTAAFHSFTLIDYDWRYRFPIILPLIMLFPISLEMILKKNMTH